MGVALQIRAGRLAVLVARAMQHRLLTACVPPVQGRYLDHIEPVPDGAVWEGGAAVATLRLPVDVYTVLRTDLLAHPDEVPVGALTPTARATVVLDVSVSGSAVAFQVSDVPGVPDDLKGAVIDLIGAPAPVDLGSLLATLGVDTAGGGQVQLVDDLLVARFGGQAGSPVPSPVRHDYEWAFVLDGPTVEELIKARIPPSLPPLQSVRTEASWGPDGWVMLKALIRGPMEVPPPAILEVTVDLGCNFSVPPDTSELRIDVGYSFDFYTGVLAYEPSVALGVEAAETLARSAVDPAAFGGVRTSESSFAINLPLPEIRLAGEQWPCEGMKAEGGGLVIGGRVNVPTDLSQVPLHTQGIHFSGGNFLGLYCSKDDQPSEVARKEQVSTVAEVSYERGGRLCDVEVLPAGAGLDELLTLPAAAPLSGGVRPGDGRIFLALGVDTANVIHEPVLLIVRTARGVRCHNLGRPEQFTVTNGIVDGVVVIYFEDCNTLPHNFYDMTPEEYERWSGMIWYSYYGLVPGKDYDPDNPPIIPDTLEEIAPRWEEISEVQGPPVEYDTTLTRTLSDEVGPTDADSMAVGPQAVDTSQFRATKDGSTVAELEQAIATESDDP